MLGVRLLSRKATFSFATRLLSLTILAVATLAPMVGSAEDATPANGLTSIAAEETVPAIDEESAANAPQDYSSEESLEDGESLAPSENPETAPPTAWELNGDELQINCIGLDVSVSVPAIPSQFTLTLGLFSGDPGNPNSVLVVSDDGAPTLQAITSASTDISTILFRLPFGYQGDLHLLATWQGASPDNQGHLTIQLLGCPFVELESDEPEGLDLDDSSEVLIEYPSDGTPVSDGSVVPGPVPVASPQAVMGSPVAVAALPAIGKTPSPLPDGIFRLPFSSSAGRVQVGQLNGFQGQDCDSHYEYPETYENARNARAIDFSLGRGADVLAVGPGRVSDVSGGLDDDGGSNDTEINITIDHQNGYFSFYTHLSKRTVDVGDPIYTGKKIGEVGKTGPFANGNHLHFAVFDSTEEPVDIRGLLAEGASADTWDDEGFAVYCNRLGDSSIPAIYVTGQPEDWTPSPTATSTSTRTEYNQTSGWSGIVPNDSSGFAVAPNGTFYVVEWLDPGSAVHVYGADGVPQRHIELPSDRTILKLFLGPDDYFYAVVRYSTSWPGIVKYDRDFNEIMTFGFGCTISAFCGDGGYYAVYANVSVDPEGNVYVQDSYGNTVGCGCIWRFSADGTPHLFLTGTMALESVYTVDPIGTVFLWRGTTLYKYLSNGQELMSWDTDLEASRDFSDIASDSAGNIYIIRESRIVKYSNNGVLLADWIIPHDEEVGPVETFELYVTPGGTIYVRGAHSGRVLTFDPTQPNRDQKMTLTLRLCADIACLATRSDLDGLSVVWSLFSTALSVLGASDSGEVLVAGEGSLEVRAVIAGGVGTFQTSGLPTGDYRVCLHANLEGPNGELVPIASQDICQETILDGNSGDQSSVSVPFELDVENDFPSATSVVTASSTWEPTGTRTPTHSVTPSGTASAAAAATITPTPTQRGTETSPLTVTVTSTPTYTPTPRPSSSAEPTRTVPVQLTISVPVSPTTVAGKTVVTGPSEIAPTPPVAVAALPETGVDASDQNVHVTAIILFASVVLAGLAVAQRRRNIG